MYNPFNPFSAGAALDYFLYYDEDQDIESDEMTEWTPVEPGHLVQLHERGLLKNNEVLSHKGWHHDIVKYEADDMPEAVYVATMWDGPMEVGEYRWNSKKHAGFDDEWC